MSVRAVVQGVTKITVLIALVVSTVVFASVPNAQADIVLEYPIPCPTGTYLNLFDNVDYHCTYNTTSGDCPNGGNYINVDDAVLPYDLCDFGIFDCGPDASFVGWGTCLPNFHVPISTEAGCMHAAAALGQDFRWAPVEDGCGLLAFAPDSELRCPFGMRLATNPDGSFVCGILVATDEVTCAGLQVTINLNLTPGVSGTDGNDVILGTPGPDVIDAGAGSDTVCGEDGDDTIDGGVGDFRDFLFGGPGDDTINGGFGIDYLYGEDGEDTLDGDGGSDRMFGGADDDLMLGDSGADRMYGGPGDDEMRGMGGQDFMWGEAGNDLMQGNFQTDNMWGGPGNDEMFGAGGKDSLFGEAGNDTMLGGNNTDYLDGGDGVDSANGGRGRDKPLIAPQVRASNGQLFDGSGCIAETIVNCQPTP